MRFILACLLLTACEKAGGVETTGGTSSHEGSGGPVGTRPSVVATLPSDAGVTAVAVADAAAARVTADAGRRDDVAMNEADARAFADLLTSDDGPNTGDMAKRRPGADLLRQIDEVRDSGRAVAVGGGAGRGGSVRGPMDSARTSTGPRGRISIRNKQALDDTTLTPDAVLAKIQSAYMAGIKRCYKTYLDKDASARGQQTLSFTVNQSGRTVNPKSVGFVQDIDDCITGQMTSWRFPVPKDKDGESTAASFSIVLGLIPD